MQIIFKNEHSALLSLMITVPQNSTHFLLLILQTAPVPSLRVSLVLRVTAARPLQPLPLSLSPAPDISAEMCRVVILKKQHLVAEMSSHLKQAQVRVSRTFLGHCSNKSQVL